MIVVVEILGDALLDQPFDAPKGVAFLRAAE
jgi:hypothetical protein